jgi:glucose-1-phosphate thymidylyltransferase
MAGHGSRMRPHTWSKAKPLIHLAGKTVLDYALAQFESLPGIENAEWVFIVGPYQLAQVQEYTRAVHPKKKVHYVIQHLMRGQSDALYLAREHLKGPMLMSFSDTLIETDLSDLKNETADGLAWVKRVEDPRRFGAARLDQEGRVVKLIEKPQDMHDNLVLVGFYYFKQGESLMAAIEEQFERKIELKGEYFLVDAVNLLLDKGAHFRTRMVKTWLDAGTRDATLETNRYLLENGHDNSAEAALRSGVKVIPPVFIPADAKITNSTIGPHVSLGSNVELDGVTITDAIIEDRAKVTLSELNHSHLGRDVVVRGAKGKLNIGDNCIVEL